MNSSKSLEEAVNNSPFWEFWKYNLVANGRELVFLVLVGFLLSFLFVRIGARITRADKYSWWPGRSVVSSSGLHVHHLVFGIITMMLAGVAGFADQSKTVLSSFAAFGFGVGVGLTLDEFALWLHLDDVYWLKEGRKSVDAVIIMAVLLTMTAVGFNPFNTVLDTPKMLLITITVAGTISWSIFTCILKERYMHALLGFFIWPIALYGAIRLAKPESRWANKYYKNDTRKILRAEERFHEGRATDRFKEYMRDIIGGHDNSKFSD